MNFIDTGIKDLYVIETNPFRDERGVFVRTYDKKEFTKINFNKEFVQMNASFNAKKGTLRGMHYQSVPFEETKLIRCIAGRIFDVAVDLRKQSSTYLKWFGCELSKDNFKMILIPGGFAHGFITLEDNSELTYCHTEFYNPTVERGIRYNDESFNISWPIDVTCISEKDKNYPALSIDN